MDYHQPLLSETTYHIFSRAIGNEKLFLNPDNYAFFLKRFFSYVSPVADVYAYNLLPNHFHAIVDIKPAEELLPLFKAVKPSNVTYDLWQPDFVMKQFSNMLNSYAKSFNKQNNRRGSLFIDHIRRVPILKDSQLSATIFYVHKNAVHHGYCKTIHDWPWSSYDTLLAPSPTLLKRKEIIDWFGNEAAFRKFHTQEIHLKNAVEVE